MPIHDLSRKIVLITGVGSIREGDGNGAVLALLFARQGAVIYGCDLNLEAAQRTADRIKHDPEALAHPSRQTGEDVIHIHDTALASQHHPTCVSAQNVQSHQQCQELVNAVLRRHGRIDILVNNVGKSEPGGPAEMSETVWDSQVEVNMKSVYNMCHFVLPIMERQDTGGCVLNVSSIAGMRYIGKPQVAYAAMKAAVIQFTKSTAVIYADRTKGKVRLNTVIPGLINTPLVQVLADKYFEGDYEGYVEKRNGQVPFGSMGTAWDVAHAGLFLCSPEAKYITGQEIVVDGAITNSTGRT